MSYRVFVTKNTKSNIRDYFLRAAEKAPLAAERWLDRFESAIASLSVHPQRCGLAPENDAVEPEIRQLLFGRPGSVFRVLFTVAGTEVQVLHIRRAVMDTATQAEIFE